MGSDLGIHFWDPRACLQVHEQKKKKNLVVIAIYIHIRKRLLYRRSALVTGHGVQDLGRNRQTVVLVSLLSLIDLSCPAALCTERSVLVCGAAAGGCGGGGGAGG